MNKYQEALNKLKHRGERFGQDLYDTAKDEIDILQDLIDQNKPLTLEECIQEWEERGWKYYYDDYYNWHCFTNKRVKNIIKIDDKDNRYWTSKMVFIDIELNELLSKTLKALEVENG